MAAISRVTTRSKALAVPLTSVPPICVEKVVDWIRQVTGSKREASCTHGHLGKV